MQYYKKNIDGIDYKVPIVNSGKYSEHVKEEKCWILDVGQDQLTHKAYYLSKELEKLGVNTIFFAEDKTGLSDENIKKDNLIAKKIVGNPFVNAFNFVKLVKEYNPIHIEFYLDIRPWNLAFFSFYAWLKRIKIIVRCRGGEIYAWKSHRLIVRWVNRYILRKADIVFIRELYMVEYIIKYNIRSMQNVFFFHNHTPVPEVKRNKFKHNILYLNSLKDFRHPSLMIEIAKELIKRKVEFKFIVVGFTDGYMTCFNTNQEEEKFLRLIKENKLEKYFELHNFTNDTEKYFNESSIFILPADIVFCNHSLMEAMAHKIVPIVQDVEGANIIIEDMKSGFLLPNNPLEYAEKIEELFSDKEMLSTVAEKAYQRILERFDSKKQAKVILTFYEEKLWN